MITSRLNITWYNKINQSISGGGEYFEATKENFETLKNIVDENTPEYKNIIYTIILERKGDSFYHTKPVYSPKNKINLAFSEFEHLIDNKENE